MRVKLTDLALKRLRPPERGTVTYFDDSLSGFGVRVSAGGTKAFTLIYGPRRERHAIGRYPAISLSEARTEAKRIISQRTLGKRHMAPVSWATAVDEFLAHKKEARRPATELSYRHYLNTYFKLGRTLLTDVTAETLRTRLDKLKGQASKRSHAFTSVRVFLRWARKRGYIEHDPTDNLDKPPVPKPRSRVLSDAELAEVYRKAKAEPHPFGPIVQLLILTAQRRGEIAALRREWVNDDAITFPAEVVKNKRDHTIPLTDQVKALLDDIEGDEHLFPASVSHVRGRATTIFNGWGKAKASFDEKLENVGPYTLHDLRRTATTGMNALGVPPHVVERILNHVSALSPMERTYNRHGYLTEMQGALTQWARHLESIP